MINADGRASCRTLPRVHWRFSNLKMIKIYSTPTCPYCDMAKNYFKEKGVKYEEADVSSDMKAREEMINKSHQMGVPVIDINGAIIVGFNRTEIDKALGK